jgi:hypothetical protein
VGADRCQNFGDDPEDIDKARYRLATAMLSVAKEDSRDVPGAGLPFFLVPALYAAAVWLFDWHVRRQRPLEFASGRELAPQAHRSD